MHKICDREVKTTGMETAGNQWGGTNFRKRFINLDYSRRSRESG